MTEEPDGRTIVFRPGITGVTIWAPLMAAMGTVIAVVFTAIAATSSYPPFFIMSAFGLALAIFGVVMSVRILRPVRLEFDKIILPSVIVDNHAYRGRREIPLTDIGGIGLAFRKMLYSRGGGPAWFLTIWVDGERPISSLLAQEPRKPFYTAAEHAYPFGHPYLFDRAFNPLPFSDLGALNASSAAGAAKTIYARVAQVQGPDGALVTQALQSRPGNEWDNGFPIYAWWSAADGSVGNPTG